MSAGEFTQRCAAAAGVALLRDGVVVLADAMPATEIQAIKLSLGPTFDATPHCEGDFYGWRTKRFGRLLTRAPASASLALHADVMAVVERVLLPSCDRLQLNLAQAIEIGPGERAQFPHRDEDMWPGPKGGFEYLVNVMWPLDDFTAANGATRIWPGSHLGGDGGPERALEAEPGSAILFLGSTLHGGGANVTPAPRRGLLFSYCLGWLRTYENQFLAYPPAVARNLDPELAALIGYRQHRPNLGNYEGCCPSILLDASAPPQNLAARDALRPDQVAAAAAHVAD